MQQIKRESVNTEPFVQFSSLVMLFEKIDLKYSKLFYELFDIVWCNILSNIL